MSQRSIAHLLLAAGVIWTTGCTQVKQAENRPTTIHDALPQKAVAENAEDSSQPETSETEVAQTETFLPANPFLDQEASLPEATSVVSTQQDQSFGVVVRDCLVEGIHDYRISANVDGVLTKLSVEEGNWVNANEVIASIDPKQAELNLTLKKAEMEQARLQAENDVNIRAAEKSRDYETAEAKSAEKLHEKQAMTFWDFRREVLEAQRSELAIELAVNDKKVAEATYSAKKAEFELAQHEIVKRQIKSMFDGIIATRYGKEGEWVQAGTPIVRVVDLETVKIEGDVDPLTTPDGVFKGAKVKIRVRVAAERFEEFDSTLEYVSPILESDNTYRVWAKIQNRKVQGRYLISPGMHAEMTILPTDGVN